MSRIRVMTGVCSVAAVLGLGLAGSGSAKIRRNERVTTGSARQHL
jgi:hypothetical protein